MIEDAENDERKAATPVTVRRCACAVPVVVSSLLTGLVRYN
jgi:hypothetical protein